MMSEAEYIPVSDSDSHLSVSDQDEFEDPPSKRIKSNETPADLIVGDDADTCSICFEPWTSSGSHKLCCLRCGHLFGYACILKWIQSQGKQSRCPQCNTKALRHDIRYLYTKNLRAIDTSERDRALAELAIERTARRKAEQEAAEHKAKNQLLLMEISQLEHELQLARAVSQAVTRGSSLKESRTLLSGMESTQTEAYRGVYEFVNTVHLSNTGNCRVMASCDYLNTLCVSQPSTSPIFRGFGIRKVNTMDNRCLKYIHLHTQALRDLAFHPDAQDGLVVSASLDKTIRLTSLLTDQVVQTYQCTAPVWSCCWASPNPNRLFAGCSNGSILVFDVRVTSGPITTLSVPENTSPVIGLQYVPENNNHPTLPGGGLLVGQLTKVTFLSDEPDASITALAPSESVSSENSAQPDGQAPVNDASGPQSPDLFVAHPNPIVQPIQSSLTYMPHSLPLEGSLASLSLIPHNRYFLASYRPSQRLPRVRHLLAELTRETPPAESLCFGHRDLYSCREVHNLWAGARMKMLTRAKLFGAPGNKDFMLAVAGSEDAGGALVWRCDTGSRLQTIQPPDVSLENPVIDVCPYYTTASDRYHLALLTERSLHLYQWATTAQ